MSEMAPGGSTSGAPDVRCSTNTEVVNSFIEYVAFHVALLQERLRAAGALHSILVNGARQ
jgi:hypothetical protein